MPKLILKYACIVDVMQVEPKPTDNQRKNRKVILHVDEEDIFDMLDSLNPKNIIKYLDMRGIPHREPANIVVKVKPDASGLKLRHSLKRVATDIVAEEPETPSGGGSNGGGGNNGNGELEG